MDFENMQSIWTELSRRIDNHNKVTDKIILDITQQKSKNNLLKIIRVQILNIFLTFLLIGYILLNSATLFNTTLTLICSLAIFAIALSYIMVWAIFIWKADKIDVVTKGVHQTLIDFLSCNKIYEFNKRIDYFLGFAIIVLICPIVYRLQKNQDVLSDVPKIDLFLHLIFGVISYTAIAYLFFKYFDKKMSRINRLLSDLKNQK